MAFDRHTKRRAWLEEHRHNCFDALSKTRRHWFKTIDMLWSRIDRVDKLLNQIK